MPFPRMTWAGLLIATLGWGFILSYPLILPFVPDSAHAVGPSDAVRFIPILGANAVTTGLAVAVLGALEKTLHLLGRIAGNANQTRPQTQAPMQTHAHTRSNHAPASASAGQMSQGMPQLQTPMLMSQRTTTDVVTRGALNGRDYVLFRDGSVVVETLLGPRRFGSITEAQEFIGTG